MGGENSGGGEGGGGDNARKPPPARKPTKSAADQANDQYQDNWVAQQAFAQEQFEWQKAQAEAALAREEALKSKIAGAVKDVNGLFADRQGIYDLIEGSSFDLNETALVDNRSDARLQTKFSLARAGLGGGSVDTDKNAEIQDRFNDGIVDARSFASDAANRAQSQDESLRSSLLSQALSGATTGSEITSAAQGQLKSIANTSPSVNPTIGGGDYFSGIANSIGQFASLYGASTAGSNNQGGYPTTYSGGGNRYHGSVS